MADENLYRVVRTDTRGNSRSVRFGTIHMVKGIVRDVNSANATRRRIANKMDSHYPYQPIELVIERVSVNAYEDVTGEFLDD